MTRYFVSGGCGFIGSHVTRRLLERPDASVVAFDNLTSGHEWYLEDVREDERLEIVVGDLKDLDAVVAAAKGCDHAYHFAANPDIAKAATEPSVDFWEGTYLTNNLIEALRINGVSRLTYSSGSGVYGDKSDTPLREDQGGLYPVSTYGASKLGCEAMMSAYCHMFDLNVVAFRFANVVGDRQTHGVVYDFVRKLMDNPAELTILGDGQQSKSYIHVNDVIDAMFLLEERGFTGFDVFNAGTEDYLTVTDIADMVVERLGLSDVRYAYTGGNRGWRGDVPVVRFDTSKIRALGWSNRLTSREAIAASIEANIAEASKEAAAR
jgi:UDP-glucose 4-epimerase